MLWVCVFVCESMFEKVTGRIKILFNSVLCSKQKLLHQQSLYLFVGHHGYIILGSISQSVEFITVDPPQKTVKNLGTPGSHQQKSLLSFLAIKMLQAWK